MVTPNQVYDIPAEVLAGQASSAFRSFLDHFFVNSYALSRWEVDLGFIGDLTQRELVIARELLRRNFKLKYSHLIEGAAALNDRDSIAPLKVMYAGEPDLSRRLTIAGTLWKIDNDPAFVDCLHQMVKSENENLKMAHIRQITWLGDARSIDLLVELLGDAASFVRYLALSRLNSIEFRNHFLCAPEELPNSARDYTARRNNQVFKTMMVNNLIEWYNPKCV